MPLADYARCDMEWWHRLAAAWSAYVDGRDQARGVKQWQAETVARMRGGRGR